MDAIQRRLADTLTYWNMRTGSMVKSPSADSMPFSVEAFDPTRVRFYLQVLSNFDKFQEILKEYDKSNTLRNTYAEAVKDIISNGEYIDSDDLESFWKEKAKTDIKDKTDANPLINTRFEAKMGGGVDGSMSGGLYDDGEKDPFFHDKAEAMKKQGLVKEKDKATATPANKERGLLNDVIKYFKDKLSFKTDTEDYDRQTKVINGIVDHPLYNLKEKDTTSMDRVIFICISFVLRGMALYILDWAINTQMVSTIQDGFALYIGVYIILFGAVCLVVNTGENNELNPFKLMVYYLNTDVNSSVRIYVHIGVQLLLLPLMIFVRDGSIQPDDSYEQRRSILRVVSNLTFFTWIITSIVAVRI